MSKELDYIETPRTPTTSIKKSRVVKKEEMKAKFNSTLEVIRTFIANIIDKIKKMIKRSKKTAKKVKKPTKAERQIAKNQRNRVIMGIGQLLVVVSIAYSTSVIFIGVDGLASKVSLFPQAAFALIILVKSFSKLYK